MTDKDHSNSEKSKEGATYVVIVISGLVLCLSGGCTLVVLGAGTAAEFALAFGAIGIVPSSILLFASLRARTIGPNWISGVLGLAVLAGVSVGCYLIGGLTNLSGIALFFFFAFLPLGAWSVSNFLGNGNKSS